MNKISIPVLSNEAGGYSSFEESSFSLDDINGMYISARLDALNFRHRMSEPGYFSDWHLAGDPTLITIRSGTLGIGLRDGSHKDFSAGDLFIANAAANEPLECVLLRSGQDPVVVNLDITPVEKPQEVWRDGLHS